MLLLTSLLFVYLVSKSNWTGGSRKQLQHKKRQQSIIHKNDSNLSRQVLIMLRIIYHNVQTFQIQMVNI